jgi:CDP-diacylglycerol--glycerol-3-phosphate 3-phosphatidyltransferase
MMNLANILTLTRLVLLPVIILFFFIPGSMAAYICLALYITGAVTDFLDGWVARKYDQVTEFGKFMDPISDKIFVTSILLLLVGSGRIEGILIVAVLIILAREFLVSGLREYLGPKNIKLPVTQLAKWKTAIQMIVIACLIISDQSHLVSLIGETGLVLAAIITAITGWQYMKAGWPHMKEE